MLNFNLERFKKLPQQPGAIWQGGLCRMPVWVVGDDGKPERPLVAMWAETRKGLVSEPLLIEGSEPFDAIFDAMIDFALNQNRAAHRPFVVEVTNPELASFLEEKLAPIGTRVDCIASLPALQSVLEDLAEHMNARPEPPAALSGQGVDPGRMRAFAEAAAKFYAARPWDELTGEDLIVVERPDAPAGMRYFSVIGNAGETFGLGFFDNLRQFQKMQAAANPERFLAHQGVWSLTFDPITALPFADADLWEDHRLPAADEKAYPFVAFFHPKKPLRRPNADELAFLEGLLHAIAETTSKQIDQGRWNRKVAVRGEATEYRLARVDELESDAPQDRRDDLANPRDLRRAMEKGMSDLQRLLSGQEFQSIEAANEFIEKNMNNGKPKRLSPRNDLERAQELMYEAWDAKGRRRLALARKALEISPNCADAYVLLAEDSTNPAAACELLQKGIQAGERALGRKAFKECVGDFWGLLETRPYMRARFDLARRLWELDRKEEAVAHYEELLRLNPNDNQGVRYVLAACLLERGAGDKLEALFQQYKDEGSAQWLYVRALAAYRKEGDSKAARKLAQHAIKSNRHVPAFLTGKRRLPAELPDSFQWGHEDEAMICAAELMKEWRAAPGAVDWLAKQQPAHRGKA